jgi:DUF177 domain-containing protein
MGGSRFLWKPDRTGTMILDLSTIRQPETVLSRRFEPSAFDGRFEDFRVIRPVMLTAKIYKDRDRFRLVGSVQTVLEFACSRCLEPFEQPVDAEFDIRYLPQSENTGEEREVEEDDLTVAFYRDDVIDLGQLLEEQFYLTLPMKPLCRDECKGLCPSCGVNLNVETCGCQVRWEDPRLAGLKALMNRNNDNA